LTYLPATALAEDYQAKLFSVDNHPVRYQVTLQFEAPSEAFRQNASSTVLDSRPEKEISRGGAMLRSLVMPGWGESYLGYHKTARYFFWTDMAIWAAVIGLESYSQWKENQFIAYAATHAGAQMSGKSDEFYADIGNYINTEAYNEAKLRERNYDAVYTSSSYYWAWDSNDSRYDYDDMRITSRSAHNKMYFFLGAAALNRLISFVDTGKKVRDIMSAQKAPQLGMRVLPDYQDGASSIQLVLSAGF